MVCRPVSFQNICSIQAEGGPSILRLTNFQVIWLFPPTPSALGDESEGTTWQIIVAGIGATKETDKLPIVHLKWRISLGEWWSFPTILSICPPPTPQCLSPLVEPTPGADSQSLIYWEKGIFLLSLVNATRWPYYDVIDYFAYSLNHDHMQSENGIFWGTWEVWRGLNVFPVHLSLTRSKKPMSTVLL